MRGFISAFLVLAIAAAGLYWLAGLDGSRLPPSPLDQGKKQHSETAVLPASPVQPMELPSEPVRPNIRDVTGEGMIPAPKVEGETIARLPAAEPPPQPPKPEKPDIWPRAEVISAGILKSGDQQIAIAEIKALDTGTICKGKDGKDWPCGNFARAALQRLVRLRSVECDPAGGASQSITTRCRISGHDIGEWLVERGWAVPGPGATADDGLAKALEKAKSGKLGQWRETAPGEG